MFRKLSCSDLIEMFVSSERCVFITIKPAPYKEIDSNTLNYMKRKFQEYWIVSCKSERGYLHYHGIVKIRENEETKKIMNAFSRKINRDIGFIHIVHMETPLENIYLYIRDNRNTQNGIYDQCDYYNNIVRN